VEQRNVVKTFPSTLEPNGGSLNTQDRSGRYFTVRYGGSNKVWDSQTDRIYSGSVTPLNLNGWVAITPDGNYLVTAAGPNKEHYSYAIDHTTQSISPTPVNFWTLCGDHGALVSATDGKSYFITFNCNNSAGIYRVDITLDQTGKTESEQITANQLLLPLAFTPVNTNEGHISAVSKGPNQDWVFFDSETLSGDPFALATTPFVPFLPWQAYEQEIVAMNVTTLEVRRYAHHRSRGLSSSYYAQPRISCSWDGSIILWTSNYNISSPTGYADMYGMAFSN
jgi:acylphosphatase